MNLIERDDYKKYIFNTELKLSMKVDFMKKYNVIPFNILNNRIIYIYNSDFSYFTLPKLRLFSTYIIVLCYIEKDEFNKYLNLLELSKNKNQAINNYENNVDTSSNILEESPQVFYHAEIENAPIVKLVDSVISEAFMLRCSDIHIEPSSEDILIRYRIDGSLIKKNCISISLLSEIIARIKVLASLDITKKFTPQDGKLSFLVNGVYKDVRVSIIPTVYGERAALRLLDSESFNPSIEELGFSKEELTSVKRLVDSSCGIILLVGPTGSGKSTTLKSFLTYNTKRNQNIITVEDPVEYVIPGTSQVQINESANLTFATCLRSILRQDPNIIMIGEIRDVETAHIACRAAITGHLVYSTLHTNTSIGVINRLIDMDIEPFLLIDSLKGIISQRLIRVLCPYCKIERYTNDYENEYLGLLEKVKVFDKGGCPHCNMSGYFGRRAIYEVVVIDEDFQDLIQNQASSNKYTKLYKSKRIRTLLDSGKDLILQGITTIEEVSSVI